MLLLKRETPQTQKSAKITCGKASPKFLEGFYHLCAPNLDFEAKLFKALR
jgi:hypothetical protein